MDNQEILDAEVVEVEESEGLPTPPAWTNVVVLLGGIACVILAGLLIWLPFRGMNWWQWILWSCGVIFLLVGPLVVGEKERLVVSVFGRFWKIYHPGLKWVTPMIMQVRSRVTLKEQPISLFPGNPTIDFKGGGRATLVDPTIWVRIGGETEAEIDFSAYKTVYSVVGWGIRVREEAESAFGNYLRTLSVEGIFDIFQELKKSKKHKVGDWWLLVKKEFPGLVDKMASWGFEVTALTITDFDWTQEVEDARRKVYESARQVEIETNLAKAAEHIAKTKAQEMAGSHGQMVDILTKDHKFEPEIANAIALQYVLYLQGTTTGSVLDIRGGGQIDVALAEALKVIERVKEKKGEK